MKKLTAFFLLAFGFPLWWWSCWKIYANLGHRLDPIVASSFQGCELYARPFAVVFIGWCVIGLLVRAIRTVRLNRVRKLAPTRSGYGIADFGVPYCSYERTQSGFRVTVKNNNYGMAGCFISMLTVPTLGILYYFSEGTSTAFPVILTITAATLYFSFHRLPSRIEVTRDTITICGTRLERDHFGSFNVHRHRQLGYQYGLRNYWLPGTWTEVEVTEIASALNAHLAFRPAVPAAPQPSPEELRDTRPTDF